MKTLIKFSLFTLLALQSTSLQANFQQSSNLQTRHYIDAEKLDFSHEGIFLVTNNGKAYPLSQINHDHQGYFIEGCLESLVPCSSQVVASCRICGTQYHNRFPQPCEHCNQSKGFNIVYIDDGY